MDATDTDIMIKLLDKALNSNSAEVKAILQSLLVTVSLVHADDKMLPGPLSKVLDEVRIMQKHLVDVRNQMMQLENKIEMVKNPLNFIYDDYRTKSHNEDDTWESLIKKKTKRKYYSNSDDDQSTFSSIKHAMSNIASKLKE